MKIHFIPSRSTIARIKTILRNSLFLIFLGAAASLSALPPADQLEKIRSYTRTIEFDYISWIADALGMKWSVSVFGAEHYLTPERQHDLVIEYIDLVRQQQRTTAEVTSVYSNPDISDPKTASAILRQELSRITNRLDSISPIAESILQDQISIVLDDMGLSFAGQTIPPVWYHTTDLPLALIISPRDTIREDADISLLPEMNIDQVIALEEEVSQDLNVSALVTEVGGIGVYPTMVMTTSNLDWLSETIAHEWIHNYLTLRPLGMNIGTNEQLRTMNETTASIAGTEIGDEVIARYYPELLPKPAAEAVTVPSTTTDTQEEPAPFNFNQQMHSIRVQVDQLLAEGKIEEAEQYMEESRRIFLENGYVVRKLNQAYFAFHGAYADNALGAAGEDPVGPAVRALRAQFPSLAGFLQRISSMTSFEELQQAVR